MANQDKTDWGNLPVDLRVELLRAGIGHPAETPEERRCRLKAKLDLLDDNDLQALADVTPITLARHRVNGTGPVPITIFRSIFYDVEDVKRWLKCRRDATSIDDRYGRRRAG